MDAPLASSASVSADATPTVLVVPVALAVPLALVILLVLVVLVAALVVIVVLVAFQGKPPRISGGEVEGIRSEAPSRGSLGTLGTGSAISAGITTTGSITLLSFGLLEELLQAAASNS